jgi:hypothetical protein
MDVRFDVSPAVLEPFGARDDTPRILTVSTNLTSGWNYTLLNAAEWLTVVQGEEGEGNFLTVNAEHIFSLYERRDTIVIRPTNKAFAALADSIAVVQAGLDLLVGSGSMDQQTRVIKIPAGGGETLLSVWSRSPWSVGTTAAERVSIDLTEGGADMENGIPIVVTVAPDTGAEEYTFTLVFDSDGEKYEYQFVQAAAEPENPEPEPENPEPQPTSK